jgi:catechol 2,3-dioxygenase
MPADACIGHIHLHVADLRQAEMFYIAGLGADIVLHYYNALFTSYGGYHHHIGLNTWNGAGAPQPAKNSVGLNWYTLVFADAPARRRAVDNLRRIGADVSPQGDFYVTRDPSGNEIRLVIGAD